MTVAGKEVSLPWKDVSPVQQRKAFIDEYLKQERSVSELCRRFEVSRKTAYKWIDRFRSIVLMSPSAVSYREMALCNVAFCYTQIGNGERAKEVYRRTLAEFPESGMAAASLRMLESIGKAESGGRSVDSLRD